jgi:hypothetical protein
MAAREIGRALPDGLNTPGAQLVVIEDAEGQRLGTIWLGAHPRRRGAAYVYDIVVDQYTAQSVEMLKPLA